MAVGALSLGHGHSLSSALSQTCHPSTANLSVQWAGGGWRHRGHSRDFEVLSLESVACECSLISILLWKSVWTSRRRHSKSLTPTLLANIYDHKCRRTRKAWWLPLRGGVRLTVRSVFRLIPAFSGHPAPLGRPEELSTQAQVQVGAGCCLVIPNHQGRGVCLGSTAWPRWSLRGQFSCPRIPTMGPGPGSTPAWL